MLADEVYGALRTYVNETLVGMGALKGAAAQLSNSYDSSTGINTMTWTWEDNDGTQHTTTVEVHDGAAGATGAQGPAGADGSDGVSPTITVKTDTSTEYVLTISAAGTTFDTPNLKGSGGSGASTLADLTDVAITSAAAGNVLQYDDATQKWINAALNLDAFTGVTSGAAGTKGMVPAPASGETEKLLCSDGNWTDKVLTDAQYAALQTLFT